MRDHFNSDEINWSFSLYHSGLSWEYEYKFSWSIMKVIFSVDLEPKQNQFLTFANLMIWVSPTLRSKNAELQFKFLHMKRARMCLFIEHSLRASDITSILLKIWKPCLSMLGDRLKHILQQYLSMTCNSTARNNLIFLILWNLFTLNWEKTNLIYKYHHVT